MGYAWAGHRRAKFWLAFLTNQLSLVSDEKVGALKPIGSEKVKIQNQRIKWVELFTGICSSIIVIYEIHIQLTVTIWKLDSFWNLTGGLTVLHKKDPRSLRHTWTWGRGNPVLDTINRSLVLLVEWTNCSSNRKRTRAISSPPVLQCLKEKEK